MKNVTRAFVFALVVTGAVASSAVASSHSTKPVVTTLSAEPTPSCAPGKTACGMGQQTN